MFEFLEDADSVIDIVKSNSNDLNFTIGEEDENGTPYSLLGDPLLVDNAPDCDVVWFEKGYATITPLMTDHTYYSKIDELKERK